MASLALGGATVNGDSYSDQAHDGVVIAGTGSTEHFPNGPVVVDVDLAGEEPVPVAGVTIDPLGGAGTFGGRPRAFELSLSLDGTTWTPALKGEMSPSPLEQPFVLREPMDARFARLRVDSTWGGTTGPVDIGEWKVVAAPGWSPSPEGFDVAAARFGGHIVAQSPMASYASEMLSGTSTTIRTTALEPGAVQRFVIGFADDRAAQVTELRWADPAGSDPAARFTTVEVEVALDSPLGPWRHLATWHLERAADGTVAPLRLPEPEWARFVRLSMPGSPDTQMWWEQPASIGVIERPTDELYRSIIGQWGQSSPRGIRELLEPTAGSAIAADTDGGDTADAAAALGEGAVGAGRVARAVDVDWYEVTIPADRNTLEVMLRTDLPRAVRMRVYDVDGAELEGVAAPVDGGVRVTTPVDPGATYRIELAQPILSVVFTFDTSASIGPWFPLVRAAIASFADDIRPGQEAVQVFPFEEPALLETFSDQAYLVRSAVDAWTTQGGSSYLEASIRRAAAELEMREGARAVLAVGDAVGGGFAAGLPLDDLERVRPIVFPVHVGGTDDPVVSTHIMQDLATTTGGHYQYATSLAEMERQFDRMATWLRRPAAYQVSYVTSLVDYPPGSIAVVPVEGANVRIGGVAVELILDTSGSMDADLGRSKRIDVAKRSLSRLVQEVLPEGLPVALRTFKAGSRRRPSCETSLAVKLGPLDHRAMLRRIERIRIGAGTRTPLGRALEAAIGDIGHVEGPRIVVLVTDGAETCKGDPEAAIRALVDAGFDTTVHIVGFALDDEDLKAKMASWAAVGGGVFLDAQDQAGLSAAIGATLRAPFRVYDDRGALVGEGIVGDQPVPVPMGTYRVEVLAHPERIVFDDVRIDAGVSVQLDVGAPAP
ncbi:MAG: VWA domain-containing protein [Chloroflexota bacterium]